MIYHHGAGFRTGELSARTATTDPPRSRIPGLSPLNRLINRRRWISWERSMERHHVEQSEMVYRWIDGARPDWLSEFI